jgi:multidrug resistance efflux pump
MKQGLAAKTATQADLDAATAELKKAQDRATAAAADWHRAQMDAAELDLKRKQQLYREGVGSRREVEQAEDRVALFTGSGAR